MDEAITFHPSPPDPAKTLAGRDVDRFNEHGFGRPLDVPTGTEVAARVYFESLLARVCALKDDRRAYSLDGYHHRCRGIWEMARHPVILDYTSKTRSARISCAGRATTSASCRRPEHVPWHQDATCWPVRPTMTVTVWLAIDDVDDGNAPMQFLPGSHRLGEIEWEPAQGDAVLYQEVRGIDRFGTPVLKTLRAGQASIHTSTLPRGSDANDAITSARRRFGVALRYIPSRCGAVEPPRALKRCRIEPGALRRAVLRNAVVRRGDPGALATQRAASRGRRHEDPPLLPELTP